MTPHLHRSLQAQQAAQAAQEKSARNGQQQSAAYQQAVAQQQAMQARAKPAMQPLQLKVTLAGDTRTLQVPGTVQVSPRHTLPS